MAWSKVRKGRKPIGWWYLKLLCEFAYTMNDMDLYYICLDKMLKNYKINLYGEKI